MEYDERMDFNDLDKQVKPKEGCPFNEPLHYHHDGCPACIEQSWQDWWDNIR